MYKVHRSSDPSIILHLNPLPLRRQKIIAANHHLLTTLHTSPGVVGSSQRRDEWMVAVENVRSRLACCSAVLAEPIQSPSLSAVRSPTCC